MKLEQLDLRSICRNSDVAICTVSLRQDRGPFTWIKAGEATISSLPRGIASLHARGKATDPECDSIYIFSLPIIGLKFEFAHNHMFNFKGWICPEGDEEWSGFNVPPVGYDPYKKAEEIQRGGEKILMVPESYYQPPFNRELFEAVRGREVEIRMGLVR